MPESTPFYPGWHNFYSRIWTTEDGQTYDGLGELPVVPTRYNNGVLGIPLPPAALLGDEGCVSGGERFPQAPVARTLPMGIDSRCYSERGLPVPVAPMGGMIVWHRPESLPAGPDGTPVAKWADDTGNGNVPTQGIPARMPTLENAGLGGLKAVVFHASGAIAKSLIYGVDSTGIENAVQLGTEYSLYIAGTTDDLFGTVAAPSIGVDVFPARSPLAAGQGVMSSGTDLDTVSVGDPVGLNEGHVWTVRRQGELLILGLDGATLLTASVNALGVSTLGGLIAYITFVPARRRCKFSEVLVYPFFVDESNHQLTVGYLRSKYGIPAP